MAKVKLYMNGVSKTEEGTEAEYVEIESDQQYALYSLGWKASPESTVPDTLE